MIRFDPILVVAALLLLPTTAPPAAADGATGEYDVVVTTTLEEKTSDESAASVTVVTAQQIEKEQSRTVGDALRAVPGIDVVQTGSAGHATTVFVRGTDQNQMLVMMDGVPLTDPYFGGYEWSTLSTESVERIEVVRGPFSAIYGSDAIGGVINIITRRGADGLHFDGSVEGGSDAYRRAQARVAGGSGGLDYFVSGSWRDGDGTFRNDDFNETVGTADVGYAIADGMRIGLQARVTDAEVGIPFEGSNPVPWRRSGTEEQLLLLPFTHRVSETFDYRVDLSHVTATYDYDDLGSAYPYSSKTDTVADRLAARAGWSVAGHHHVAFGAELEKLQIDNEDNFAINIDGESNDSWGGFVQDAMTFDRLSLTVGVRFDDHDTFGSAVSPRAAVAYRFGGDAAGLKLRAGYGQAFRAPSAGELYFPGSGNVDLEAEESRSYEVGVAGHWSDGRYRAELTWFDNTVKNLIDFEFSTFTFQNLGEARMRGAELSFEGRFGHGFSTRLAYTRLRARDEETGLALKRRPENSASLDLDYAPDGKLDLHLRALWMDDRPDLDPDLFTDITTPGYTRVDLAAAYRALEWLAPFVRVENVADENYSEAAGFPAPGREIVAGVRFIVD